jgi:hypothetical protein
MSQPTTRKPRLAGWVEHSETPSSDPQRDAFTVLNPSCGLASSAVAPRREIQVRPAYFVNVRPR